MDYKKKYLKYKEKYLNYRMKYSKTSDLNNLNPNVFTINNKSLENTSQDLIINNLGVALAETKLEDGEFTDINTINNNEPDIPIQKQKQTQIDILKKTIQKIDITSMITKEPVINYNFAESIINDNKLINIENGNIVFDIYTHPNYRISVYNNTISFPGLSIILNDNMDTNDNIKIDDIDNKTFECKHIINIPNSNLVNGVTITQLLKIINMKNPKKTDKFFIRIKKIHDKLFEELLIKYNKEINIDIDSYNKNEYITYEKNSYNNEYNINNMYDFL